jgi:3-deoxy-D-manno-octulosonic acid (KDO) 8-phosphate synthase
LPDRLEPNSTALERTASGCRQASNGMDEIEIPAFLRKQAD